MPDVSISWSHSLLRLAIAGLLGAVIGAERELDEKSAGLRTHMLVSVGAALFTLVSAYGFSDIIGKEKVSYDPSRIAAQIVTGIGFLGAGVIFRSGLSIRGLTTAASLWLVAAVGMAAGAGYWAGAVLGTAVGLVSLRPFEWLKRLAIPHRGPVRLVVRLAEDRGAGSVVREVERQADVLGLRRDGRRVEIEVRLEKDRRPMVLEHVAALNEVEEARWEP